MKKDDKTKKEKVVKKRSPFKESHLLEKEIVSYINKFKSTVSNSISFNSGPNGLALLAVNL